MTTDIKILTVDGPVAKPLASGSLAASGFLETVHLEQWVVDNPAVLGAGVVVVARQYSKWSSSEGDLGRERLDVLALDTSGQLIVVELKRGNDARIHLQAVTYAALVAGFDKLTLAEAHAEYLTTLGTPCTKDEALLRLEEHVIDDWNDDILKLPRIVLIAESYAAQTLTTVAWLSDIAPKLTIEMHTVNVFHDTRDGQESTSCVVFRRQYPPDDPSARVLTPGLTSIESAATRIAQRQRAARSTYLLYDNTAIPEGSTVELNLRGAVAQELVAETERWIQERPARGLATWTRNRDKPLRWDAETEDSERTWTPTSLAKHVVMMATNEVRDAIPGGDVWFYRDKSLITLAREVSS
ncbi:DNA-binding protein [Gordonia sp. NPDC057258]|uniref:DNA-binding protein n=1 Tax=unclassified Gordonia (in: high G+C Gram-positive bacteria) TaxID=2657482 RepID=UPI00362649DD